MISWRPQTELEQEIVSMQPECNFIYGTLTDNQKKLQNGCKLVSLNRSSKSNSVKNKSEEDTYTGGLNGVRAVHRLLGGKSLAKYGNYDDMDNLDNLSLETVAMIRSCGMGPTIDEPLNEKTTIPTLPIPKKIIVGQGTSRTFPIDLDDESFKFTSTRMRNAKIRENFSIDSSMKDVNGIDIDQKKSIKISVLNEVDDNGPTEEEIASKKYEDFLKEYPNLEKKNTSKKGRETGVKSSNMKGPSLKVGTNSLSSKKRSPKLSEETHEKAENVNFFTNKNQRKFEYEGNLETSLSNSVNSSVSSRSNESFETCTSSSSYYFSANGSLRSNKYNTNETEYKEKRYYTPKQIYNRKRPV